MALEAKFTLKGGETVSAEVDFVSFLNSGSYGPPALIAPAKSGVSPLAKPGDVVLYVNTECITHGTIERFEDDD